MTAVLFVCLGNICRSPLAEAAFREASVRAGFAVSCDSAAARDWHTGNPPDRRSIAIARKHGVDISQQRARALVAADFERFSHIIGMDQSNLAAIHAMAPDSHDVSISLLLDHVPGREGEDLKDPWYGRAVDFQRTWADVTLAADMLVQKLLGESVT